VCRIEVVGLIHNSSIEEEGLIHRDREGSALASSLQPLDAQH
jgi:hypothetical protein